MSKWIAFQLIILVNGVNAIARLVPKFLRACVCLNR